MNLGHQSPVDDLDHCQGDGQPEPARARTARVEINNVIAALDTGTMRMTGNHEIDAHPGWSKRHILSVVDHEYFLPEQRHLKGMWKHRRPRLDIDIAANCRDWRNTFQSLDDGGVSNVARMDDVVGALEKRNSVVTQKAVRI